MKDWLKAAGGCAIWIAVLVVALFLGTLVIKGGVWLSELIYPWLVIAAMVTFAICVLLLPFACFKATRNFAGTGIYYGSFVFGLTVWVWAMTVAFFFWNYTGLIIGLLIYGVGVVFVAFLAALFHAQWMLCLEIAGLVVFTITVRFFGLWLISKANPSGGAVHLETPELDA